MNEEVTGRIVPVNPSPKETEKNPDLCVRIWAMTAQEREVRGLSAYKD